MDRDTRIAALEDENARLTKAHALLQTELVMSKFDRARAEASAAVKVKPLEWARGWMNAEAQTEIGRYEITYRRDGSFEWSIGCLKEWASSWDAAKSAAQADFERRILSALSPSAQQDAEAVAASNVCASEDCEKPATVRFERGGVGSEYCADCYLKIQAIPFRPKPVIPSGLHGDYTPISIRSDTALPQQDAEAAAFPECVLSLMDGKISIAFETDREARAAFDIIERTIANPPAPAVTEATQPKDVEAIRAHASRVLERMVQTPYGPKRDRLADQHIDLLNQALRAEGWNAALQAIEVKK